MNRPRLLLVPQLTELEWGIAERLREWADVATFDAPGVGAEPAPPRCSRHAVARRGCEEIERRGWDRCVVIGDEYGCAMAVAIASEKRDAVAGLALGHASLSHDKEGERAPISGAVGSALNRLLANDYRAFARALTQATQGAYDDEVVSQFVERVPPEVAGAYHAAIATEPARIEPALRRLGKPLLLAEHEGCLRFTREGFEDIVAAFPQATVISTAVKPSMSDEFADALRAFCERLPGP